MKIFRPRPILGILLCVLCVCVKANAQTSQCPADLVCITRDAAVKALQDADTVKAQAAEIKVKDQAINDLKTELNKMRVEYANEAGAHTACKTAAVRTDAIIDLLLKNQRPKKIGLIVF